MIKRAVIENLSLPEYKKEIRKNEKILKQSIFFGSVFLNLIYSALLCVAWFKQVDIRNFGVTITLILLAITSITTLAITLSGKK